MINIAPLISACEAHIKQYQASQGSNNMDSNNLDSYTMDAKSGLNMYSSLCLSLDLNDVSWHQPLPITPATDKNYFYWSRPDKNQHRLGLGKLVSIQSQGENRFQDIKQQFQTLRSQWQNNRHLQPVAFMGFAFHPTQALSADWGEFPNTLLTVPIILIEQHQDQQTICVNFKPPAQQSFTQQLQQIKQLLKQHLTSRASASITDIAPHLDISKRHQVPKQQQWLQTSRQAIQLINQADISKLVPSRKLVLETRQPVNAHKLLSRLSHRYPGCTIIGCGIGQQQLIAATPERLLSLHGRDFQCDAIGGTLSSEDTPSIASLTAKLLQEHQIIVDDIHRRLESYCQQMSIPLAPVLMKLHKIYHLLTPIQGCVYPQHSLFDLIACLHPSPAIAGFPTAQAQSWLSDNEAYDRGWYTGAFGWLNADNEGELSVLLRCALISDNHMDIFAGAGLVAESVAESEWMETELKMNTILDLI